MTKYWLKIGLSAFLIFIVGFSVLSAVRHVKGSVESGRDLTIPLGAFGAYLPFKLNGAKVGSLRSLVIHRSSPKVITGFTVRGRVTDSAAAMSLLNCKISVNNPTEFNENSTFTCLASDSGYVPFGAVQLDNRSDASLDVLGLTLLLPEHIVRDLQSRAGDQSPADSMARELSGQVRIQARVISDSLRAASLEERAKAMQQRADSIRANLPKPTKPAKP